MTDTVWQPRHPAGHRLCFYCETRIAERWPAYLVTTPDKRLVGPFHAACAQLAVNAARELKARGLDPLIGYKRIVHVAREETLPE